MEFVWDASPTFGLFGLTIRYYTVFFAALFLVGIFPLRWQIARGGGEVADSDYLVIGALAGVLIGGRLVHVFFYEFAAFVADPAMLFDFARGGLASHGSVAGLILSVAAVARWRGYRFVDLCDRVTFSSMIGAVCVRLGNFFNSEIVGRATDQTWGVRFPRYDHIAEAPLRHPSQLYEAALALLALAVLIAVDRKLGEERPVGLLVSVVFALYFGGRFFLEFFKEFQALSADSVLTMGQWLSLPAALLGILGTAVCVRRLLRGASV